jgi:HK97 family phage portal protein
LKNPNLISRIIDRIRGKGTFSSVPTRYGFLGPIYEPWAGAWQTHTALESKENLLTFSAVYACIALISGDVAKLRAKLTKRNSQGIWEEVENSPFYPVIRKPNHYQTRIQFFELWLVSKLMYGNTYVLKERDSRGVVNKLFVLEPTRVMPLVATSGDVFYQVSRDDISGVPDELIFPESEIIHDRGVCLYHPLVGVSPLHACAYSGTQGVKIQQNSSTFFNNMSRPSGMITGPNPIPDDTAARLKREWEANYSGANLGRVAVAGSGLDFKTFTIPAQEAQLIEQLKWTAEDVARAFQVPLHMIGAGQGPTYASEQARTLSYYTQTLQKYIEAIEVLLDEGLSLPNDMGTEFDLDALLRMDSKTRAETNEIRLRSGELAPNEARKASNLPSVDGGDTPFMQRQNWPINLLGLDALPPEPVKPTTTDEDDAEEEMRGALVISQTSRKFERAMYELS